MDEDELFYNQRIYPKTEPPIGPSDVLENYCREYTTSLLKYNRNFNSIKVLLSSTIPTSQLSDSDKKDIKNRAEYSNLVCLNEKYNQIKNIDYEDICEQPSSEKQCCTLVAGENISCSDDLAACDYGVDGNYPTGIYNYVPKIFSENPPIAQHYTAISNPVHVDEGSLESLRPIDNGSILYKDLQPSSPGDIVKSEITNFRKKIEYNNLGTTHPYKYPLDNIAKVGTNVTFQITKNDYFTLPDQSNLSNIIKITITDSTSSNDKYYKYTNVLSADETTYTITLTSEIKSKSIVPTNDEFNPGGYN